MRKSRRRFVRLFEAAHAEAANASVIEAAASRRPKETIRASALSAASMTARASSRMSSRFSSSTMRSSLCWRLTTLKCD